MPSKARGTIEELLTSCDGFLEILDGSVLGGEASLLMVEPAELLQDLRVVRVAVEDTEVRRLGAIKLYGNLG